MKERRLLAVGGEKEEERLMDRQNQMDVECFTYQINRPLLGLCPSADVKLIHSFAPKQGRLFQRFQLNN